MFEQNLVLMRKFDHPAFVAFSLGDLGFLAWEMEDYQGAEQRFDEMLALFRKIGDKQFEPIALFGSGRAASGQGKYDRARIFFHESLALQQIVLPLNIQGALEALAFLEATQDNQVCAARLLGATQTCYTKSQLSITPRERRDRENAIASLRRRWVKKLLREPGRREKP